MRQYAFNVKFMTGKSEQVMAFNKTEAIILAQAEQIKKGNEYKHISDIYTID